MRWIRRLRGRWRPRWPRDKQYSEFGRGCLVCLVGFLDHKSQLITWIAGENVAKILGEDHAVRMWANGASDHLYELQVPPALVGTPLGDRLQAFQKRWLDIGHGFRDSPQLTVGDVHAGLAECERLALEVAAELDRTMGLKTATVGEWT